MELKTPMKRPTITLEPRSQYLLAGMGALVALVLVVRFLYLPVLARIGRELSRLNDLRVKTADVQTLISQRRQYDAALQDSQARYRAFTQTRLGSGLSLARILEALNQEAKDHRVQVEASQPHADEGESRLIPFWQDIAIREVLLTVEVTGRYRHISEWLGDFSKAPFMVSVRQLTMAKPQADSSKLRADLTLAVYLPERTPSP